MKTMRGCSYHQSSLSGIGQTKLLPGSAVYPLHRSGAPVLAVLGADPVPGQGGDGEGGGVEGDGGPGPGTGPGAGPGDDHCLELRPTEQRVRSGILQRESKFRVEV